ncbi:hypothetical protein F5X68DRAFT_225669 [Plectosphaerella plurivora]|uniref:SnoaL-like domain-containing protein n=1 Tax=Plectosphaerella plurivora TaxID=936078 RepID=A0A9P9A681_9PEZI|nr:hypothetical protein F5X68DRAFT_225669 [Plectosphaerella plurivora]
MASCTPIWKRFGFILHLTSIASACAGGSYIHMEDGYVGCVTPAPVTCQSIGTCAYDNNTAGPWTPEANMRQMQLTDDAYNAMDFARFNHREDTIVYMPGDREFNMVQHVQDMTNIYASYPDNRVSNHPYKLTFAEGNWTFGLSDLLGTNTGPIQGPNGWRGPTNRRVNYEFLTAAYWEDGRIVREHIWMDLITLQRQLGFFPLPIDTDGTQSLALSPFSLPLAVNPEDDVSANNKDAYQQVEFALLSGDLSPESLRVSSNITIFTSRDDAPNGLTSDQFITKVQGLQSTFSDVRIVPNTIIGSGDWTATIGRLSGRHTGALNVPDFISPVPIPATNNTFEVWLYSIARWQNGEMTHLKLMTDELAILGQIQQGN